MAAPAILSRKEIVDHMRDCEMMMSSNDFTTAAIIKAYDENKRQLNILLQPDFDKRILEEMQLKSDDLSLSLNNYDKFLRQYLPKTPSLKF
jgi:predicted secreted Zn-dependent protease